MIFGGYKLAEKPFRMSYRLSSPDLTLWRYQLLKKSQKNLFFPGIFSKNLDEHIFLSLSFFSIPLTIVSSQPTINSRDIKKIPASFFRGQGCMKM